MDDLMRVLGPVIACGIALQQFLELIDPALDRFIQPHKKWILSLVSLVFALALTAGLGLGIRPARVSRRRRFRRRRDCPLHDQRHQGGQRASQVDRLPQDGGASGAAGGRGAYRLAFAEKRQCSSNPHP